MLLRLADEATAGAASAEPVPGEGAWIARGRRPESPARAGDVAAQPETPPAEREEAAQTLAMQADDPAAPPGTAAVPDGPRRVLIADEDAVTVRVLRHRFERDGLAVDVVADGFEAVASLQASPPAAALLNVALVGIDGFEIVRRIRAGAAGPPDLPVALMCWAGNDALIVRGFALDADDLIVRPFSLAEVSARIRRLARRSVAAGPA